MLKKLFSFQKSSSFISLTNFFFFCLFSALFNPSKMMMLGGGDRRNTSTSFASPTISSSPSKRRRRTTTQNNLEIASTNNEFNLPINTGIVRTNNTINGGWIPTNAIKFVYQQCGLVGTLFLDIPSAWRNRILWGVA